VSSSLSLPGGVLRSPARLPGGEPVRYLPLPAGWPLTALLVLYPLWWVLGLGTLIVFVLAVPMAVHLLRRRPIAVPPGFALWLLFLGWVLISTTMLGSDPPNVLPGHAGDRVISVAFNLAGYLAATIILLYVGNLREDEFPRKRLMRQLGWLFVVVVSGGLLGTFAPTFELTSLTELVLPRSMTGNLFVQSLVHPTAAQLQEVLGYTSPRPAAPFGYTNTWGNAIGLLIGWFVVSCFSERLPRRRALGVIVLLAACIPVVYSLNRGLWIGLGLVLAITVVRLALRGRVASLVALVLVVVVAAVAVVTSPLSGIVSGRLDNPKSNDIRAFTLEQTLEAVSWSPVLGFGSPRAARGSSNSIAIGQSDDCQRCGNPTIGSNGQLWLLLIAQGWVGAALYVGFFLRSLWAYRRDRSPIGDAGLLAVGLPLFFMFVYNALTMPLVISFLSIALLWRNAREAEVTDAPERPLTRSPLEALSAGPSQRAAR
jgi:O-antigen ligase